MDAKNRIKTIKMSNRQLKMTGLPFIALKNSRTAEKVNPNKALLKAKMMFAL